MGAAVVPVMRMGDLLDVWRWHQSAAGHTDRTVDQRVKVIRSLAGWVRKQPEHLTAADLVAWLARDLAPWSKRTYFMAARAWFRWLAEHGHRDRDETEGLPVPKAPRVLPRPMSDEQLARALTLAGPRSHAYLTLAAFAGLRAMEVAAVHGRDLDGLLLTVRGKGGTLAMVPVHPRVAALAADHPRDGYWFPGVDHGHVRARAVSLTVTKHLRRHGITGSLHRARHWYGTNVLRSSGGNVRVTQTLLRHASIATTAGYTLVVDDERAAAVAALSLSA